MWLFYLVAHHVTVACMGVFISLLLGPDEDEEDGCEVEHKEEFAVTVYKR